MSTVQQRGWNLVSKKTATEIELLTQSSSYFEHPQDAVLTRQNRNQFFNFVNGEADEVGDDVRTEQIVGVAKVLVMLIDVVAGHK